MVEVLSRPVSPADRATWPRELRSLTGMRFIAALMVFLSHICLDGLFANQGVLNGYTRVFMQGGFTGVGFFFVLSGFVLTWSARPGDSAPRFWRRRICKIYPNHLVTFVAAAILLGTVTHQAFDGWSAVRNVLLLQAWRPTPPGFNIVAWSLSCEALFYFAFPLLFLLIRRIRPQRLWYWAGAVIAAILVIPLIATTLSGEPWLWYAHASVTRFWFVYSFPVARLLDFVFGILLARIVMTGRRVPLGIGPAAALAVLSYAVAPVLPMTYKLTATTVVPLGLVIAAGAVADIHGRGTFLARRPMVFLGNVSFAFYMVHWMVLTFGIIWIGGNRPTPLAVAIILGAFAVTLLLAWLLYALVERPFMRRFATSRRRSMR